MSCSKCRKEVQNDWKFCPNCGQQCGNNGQSDWGSTLFKAGACILTDIVLPIAVGDILDSHNVTGIKRRVIEVGTDFIGKTSVELAGYGMGYSVYEGPAEVLLAKTCDVILRQFAREAIGRGFKKISVEDSRCKTCFQRGANVVVSRIIDMGTSKGVQYIRKCNEKCDKKC